MRLTGRSALLGTCEVEKVLDGKFPWQSEQENMNDGKYGNSLLNSQW